MHCTVTLLNREKGRLELKRSKGAIKVSKELKRVERGKRGPTKQKEKGLIKASKKGPIKEAKRSRPKRAERIDYPSLCSVYDVRCAILQPGRIMQPVQNFPPHYTY